MDKTHKLTQAQEKALNFLKNNDVYLKKDELVSLTQADNQRFTKTFQILLDKGFIYKASLNPSMTKIVVL